MIPVKVYAPGVTVEVIDRPPIAPVDCVLSAWGPWVNDGTPTPCVNGTQQQPQKRTRTVVTQPANGGAACGPLTETQTISVPCTVTPPPTVTGSLSQVAAAAGNTPGWYDVVPVDFVAVSHGENGNGIFPFINTMPWNPVSKGVCIVGEDHGSKPETFPPYHVDYVDATNSFIVVSRGQGTHGYQHLALDAQGNKYLWMQGIGKTVNGFVLGSYGIYKYDPAVLDFVKISVPPENMANINTIALNFWPGYGGPQGSLFVQDMNTGGTFHILRLSDLTWTTMQNMFPGASGTIQNVGAYSAKYNCLVYGGGIRFGGVNPLGTQVWRMNADGSKTRMPDAPHLICISAGMSMVSDFKTGNILLTGFGEQWMLNPFGSGTMTQLPTPPIPTMPGIKAQLACSTPYGVVWLTRQLGFGPITMKLQIL